MLSTEDFRPPPLDRHCLQARLARPNSNG
jgi:hypothetical protein